MGSHAANDGGVWRRHATIVSTPSMHSSGSLDHPELAQSPLESLLVTSNHFFLANCEIRDFFFLAYIFELVGHCVLKLLHVLELRCFDNFMMDFEFIFLERRFLNEHSILVHDLWSSL